MISIRDLWQKLSTTKWKWVWITLVLLPAIRLYYIQEMIAALLIFSVLFAVVATVALIIFLLDRASDRTVAWAEPGVGRLARSVVRAAEGVIIASPVWAEDARHRFQRMLAWAEPRIRQVAHRVVEVVEAIAASPVWVAALHRFRRMLAWAESRISQMVDRVVDAVDRVIASPVWVHVVSHRSLRKPLQRSVKKSRILSSFRPRFSGLIQRQVRRIRLRDTAHFT